MIFGSIIIRQLIMRLKVNMTNEIVFIDDNRESLESLIDYLDKREDLELNITFFQDPEKGIEYIIEKRDFVAILIDVNMPKIDGKYVAEKLTEQNIKAPLIFLTVIEPEKNFLKECYGKGIIDYILKPRGNAEHYIVAQKLKVFSDLYSANIKLKKEEYHRQKISSNFNKLNKTYMDLINETKTAIIIIDQNDNIVEMNEFYKQIMPYPEKTIKHNIDKKYIEKYDELLKKIIKEQSVEEVSFKLKESDKWVNMTATNIYNSKVAFLVKDVTSKMKEFMSKKEDVIKRAQSIRDHINCQLDKTNDF